MGSKLHYLSGSILLVVEKTHQKVANLALQLTLAAKLGYIQGGERASPGRVLIFI